MRKLDHFTIITNFTINMAPEIWLIFDYITMMAEIQVMAAGDGPGPANTVSSYP